MSRTALDGYVLGDVEKEYLLGLIKKLSSVKGISGVTGARACAWKTARP